MKSQFTLLFVTLIGLVLLLPAIAYSPYGLVSQAALSWCVIAASVWALESLRVRSIALLLAILALAADSYLWITQATAFMPFGRILIATFLGFVTCAILLSIMTREEVTFDVVIGGACTYILIGAFFAQVYAVFEIVAPGSLLDEGGPLGSVDAADLARGHIVEVLYYSLVTLTTLGYGDIVPGTPLVRAVSTVEALLGQLYPAILIAHLVSLRAARSPVRHSRDDAEHGSLRNEEQT
jgi:hypothetical protein